MEFSLADQYGKNFQLQFPAGKVNVIIFADRQGSAQVEGWVRPLYERYRESIQIFGVAQLPGVPPPIQSLLRAIFRRQVQYPVMLDWHGTISNKYDYRGQRAALVVVDREGFIRYRAEGQSSPEILKICFDIIDRLI